MQPPTSNSSQFSPKPRRRLGAWLVLLILVGLLGTAAANRQNVWDWWQLKHYQAPADVAGLADQDTMTASARKIFYVNQPAIDDKASFAKACAAGGAREQTIILGCYHGNQAGIFVLAVSDPRLSGVEQVTAAHEMLHAAYDRLSAKDKQQIDKQLMDYYQRDLHDQRILATIDAYKKTEPNDLVNEMHSIFGTEITSLPPGLEQYYQRYFTNRAQIATFAAQYQAAFTSRQATLTGLENQLDDLKSQIQATEDDLKAKKAAIDDKRTQLQAAAGGNTAAYNAGVPAYNKLVDAYNAEVQTVRNLINQFNQLVSQHNDLVLEQSQLRNELDANSVTSQNQ
jgi:hypothetical protein